MRLPWLLIEVLGLSNRTGQKVFQPVKSMF